MVWRVLQFFGVLILAKGVGLIGDAYSFEARFDVAVRLVVGTGLVVVSLFIRDEVRG